MEMKRAFTLIELLIVVAIIGILAAIAVPNFINAITRAKIARVQSDFKNLANAFEMYNLDRGVYPVIAHVRFSLGRLSLTDTFDWNCLTTPISYVGSNVFKDPFITGLMHNKDFDPAGLDYGPERFWYEVGHQYNREGINQEKRQGKNEWGFGSIGPDSAIPGIGIGSRVDYTKRGMHESYDDFQMNLYPYWTKIRRYDASNGLMSKGDIHYFNTGTPSRYSLEVDGVKRNKLYGNYY